MGRLASRDGYALLAVLWITAAIAALGITVSAAAHEAITSSRNRIAAAEAEWLARGCLAHVRSLISGPLVLDRGSPRGLSRSGRGASGEETRGDTARAAASVWLRLDSLLAEAPSSSAGGCTTTATAVGARLDVNTVDERVIAGVLTQVSSDAARADSAAAALADWRDADDESRPLGAERDWYERSGRVPPSNRPLADRREIGLVKGMSSFDWDGLLDVEAGPISINHAPAPILATLPGLSPQAIARVVELRRRGRTLGHFRDIADQLTTPDANGVMDAVPALASRVSFQPAAWVVRTAARAGAPVVTVVIELRLERSGALPRVARRRVWIQ